jgi:hypothetical protein
MAIKVSAIRTAATAVSLAALPALDAEQRPSRAADAGSARAFRSALPVVRHRDLDGGLDARCSFRLTVDYSEVALSERF